MAIQFTTLADLGRDLPDLLARLPQRQIGAVVGVARSGMIPATLIASVLNVPLAEASTWLDRQLPLAAGCRLGNGMGPGVPSVVPGKALLVVEDAVKEAVHLNATAAAIREAWAGPTLTCAVYATDECAPRVDYVGRILPPIPRLFEWNWLYCPFIRRSGWDVDGVLCVDPTLPDDNVGYLDHVAYAAPLYAHRRYRLPLIVTNRLECHRAATEYWLRSQGIQWDRLVMHPADSPDERARSDGYPFQLKADAYAADPDLALFIESHANQARQIHHATGRPVLCPTEMRIYQ